MRSKTRPFTPCFFYGRPALACRYSLVYECRRDKTFFFIVRENDQELIDLLDGESWAVWVGEKYSPYIYEGGMVKVLKPEFAGLNLAGFQ